MADSTEHPALTIDPRTHVADLPFIHYQDDTLFIDNASTKTLAQTYGTPLYVYSKNALLANYRAYVESFAPLSDVKICYAVKSNSNLAILATLAHAGAGFDIVSSGELARVLKAGGQADKVVYSGVGKTKSDIATALNAGVGCFNVEAVSEIELISQVASEFGKTAPIALRINPDVDAKTHPYISTGMKDNKFGISHDNALDAYRFASSLPNLDIIGIDCHIGSQLTDTQPFVDALDKVIELIDELFAQGISLRHVDLGGGLGVRYTDETPASVSEYANALLPKLLTLQEKYGLGLHLEPGRNISANAGVLLTNVDALKPTEYKNFAIVDASMCELMRPALYGSVMAVIPADLTATTAPQAWDIVGSVCESSDFLAKNRTLALNVGDTLAITGAGAYGFVMASNYNTRPRPAEIMCDDGSHRVVRERESLDDLWRGESV
ncbi:diaminopimelate decarboxylase [Moraxella bovis]|uniref:diaminopimelate decarboxylase n=1 Tax=Moraxella bovis TaxID=476 RepID=UPI002227E89F|nr:diaminopimelate decarboxylase [Moraxella bovis]UYZ71835.1 diaminopimelate decarboxylase [Moraxella bovis]UYZ72251.1 diaminopimelate decarboxylase [Moraxella bovis]UZA15132.1 diaminopimelate decarboxylase [Moraxella bovis]UZA38958.1 diaminopimelate decarboxylase [Moraxella bovis]UZA42131.1 diaminopimelate decarboxylase [Moraxella bovis]